jgi:hypothetical protein
MTLASGITALSDQFNLENNEFDFHLENALSHQNILVMHSLLPIRQATNTQPDISINPFNIINRLPPELQLQILEYIPQFTALDTQQKDQFMYLIEQEARLSPQERKDLLSARLVYHPSKWTNSQFQINYTLQKQTYPASFDEWENNLTQHRKQELGWNTIPLTSRHKHFKNDRTAISRATSWAWKEIRHEYPPQWHNWTPDEKHAHEQAEKWAISNFSPREWRIYNQARFTKPWDMTDDEIPVMKKFNEGISRTLSLIMWGNLHASRNGMPATTRTPTISLLKQFSQWTAQNLTDGEWRFSTYDPAENIPVNRVKNAAPEAINEPGQWPQEKISARIRILNYWSAKLADTTPHTSYQNLLRLYAEPVAGLPRINSSQAIPRAGEPYGFAISQWIHLETSSDEAGVKPEEKFILLLSRSTDIENWTDPQRRIMHMMERQLLANVSPWEWYPFERDNNKTRLKRPGGIKQWPLHDLNVSQAFAQAKEDAEKSTEEWFEAKKQRWTLNNPLTYNLIADNQL